MKVRTYEAELDLGGLTDGLSGLGDLLPQVLDLFGMSAGSGARAAGFGLTARITMLGLDAVWTNGGPVAVEGQAVEGHLGSGLIKRLLEKHLTTDLEFGPDYIQLPPSRTGYSVEAVYDADVGVVTIPVYVTADPDYRNITVTVSTSLLELIDFGVLLSLKDVAEISALIAPGTATAEQLQAGRAAIGVTIKLRMESERTGTAPTPQPRPGPTPNPRRGNLVPDDQNIRALFLTEFLCFKEFGSAGRHEGLEHARQAYTHIYSLADLQRNGAKKTRSYVNWVRDRDLIDEQLFEQVAYAKRLGYRMIICGLNAWGARHGYGLQCGAIQRELANEGELYTDEQLEIEKRFFLNLWDRLGHDLAGYMPLLEAEHTLAADFERRLVQFIREQGYKGPVLTNHIGTARGSKMQRVQQVGAWSAGSINHANEWGGYQVHNSDGMTALNANDHDLISDLTARPGDHGFIIWSKELAGNHTGSNVPTKLGREYTDYAYVPDEWPREGGSLPTPTPSPTPGGWQDRNLKQGFLWKPEAEGGRPLVILFPTTLRDVYDRNNPHTGIYARFPAHSSGTIEPGSFDNDEKNGQRIHYRFGKQGGHYPDNCWAVIFLKDGTQVGYQIGDSASRNENTITPQLVGSNAAWAASLLLGVDPGHPDGDVAVTRTFAGPADLRRLIAAADDKPIIIEEGRAIGKSTSKPFTITDDPLPPVGDVPNPPATLSFGQATGKTQNLFPYKRSPMSASWPPAGEQIHAPTSVQYRPLTADNPPVVGPTPPPTPDPGIDPQLPTELESLALPRPTDAQFMVMDPELDPKYATHFVYDPLGLGVTLPLGADEADAAFIYLGDFRLPVHQPSHGPRIKLGTRPGSEDTVVVGVRYPTFVHWYEISLSTTPEVGVYPLRAPIRG